MAYKLTYERKDGNKDNQSRVSNKEECNWMIEGNCTGDDSSEDELKAENRIHLSDKSPSQQILLVANTRVKQSSSF